jgi:hypothetical protein
MSHNQTVDGVDIVNNLLAVTFISHRNHTQTIIEMFQFMYYFIDAVDTTRINNYLGVSILFVLPEEQVTVRSLVKLFYYQVFKHFMDKYDSLNFESPANFSTNDFDSNDTILIQTYVKYFLTGRVIIPPAAPGESQVSLAPVVAQMEFYFCAEMMNQRESTRLYNKLFDPTDLADTVGKTTADMIQLVRDVFAVKDDFTVNPTIFSDSDTVRKYWDDIYQHNIRNGNNDQLYYSTFDIDRYRGNPYDDTGYNSRHFDIVVPPLAPATPLPSTDPYGVPTIFYDHKQVITDYTPLPPVNIEQLQEHLPVFWTSTNRNTVNSIPLSDNFQLFDVDYFRIKHLIFYNPVTLPPTDIIFIDEYQFNLLRLVKLTERLNSEYPTKNQFLTFWLYITLSYLISNTDISEAYDNYQFIYDIGTPTPTLYNMLVSYLAAITNALIQQSTSYPFSSDLGAEMIVGTRELFDKFNQGIRVVIITESQASPYLVDNLIANNVYTFNTILNAPVSPTDNVSDLIKIIRDNFLSEYFYHIKYQQSTLSIDNFGDISDVFNFRSINVITSQIIEQINVNDVDLTPLTSATSVVFLYPDVYPNETTAIINLRNQLDDYSQNIFDILVSFVTPKSVPRLTFRDYYDIINISFTAIKQIYSFIRDDPIMYGHVVNVLRIYQPLMLDKIVLFDQIITYILEIPPGQFMTVSDAVAIASIAATFGIDENAYFNYIINDILPEFNSLTSTAIINGSEQLGRVVLINLTLGPDLDYFFIRFVFGDPTATFQVTYFKTTIIEKTFVPGNPVEDNIFKINYNLVDNENYSFVLTFINYATINGLLPTEISNPLFSYGKNTLINDQSFITTQYNSFERVSNSLEYLLDYIWDWTMTVCNKNPSDPVNTFGFTNRFSLDANQLHLNINRLIQDDINYLVADREKAISEKNQRDSDIADEDNRLQTIRSQQINNIMQMLETATDEVQMARLADDASTFTYQVSNVDYYFGKLSERSEIITFIKDVAIRGIVDANDSHKNAESIRRQMYDVLYRNKKAKVAWIRKLAHFAVKHVSISMNDEITDIHDSNWFETFHETSKHNGSENGYLKMIAHRDDLIVFNDKIKQSYTVTLPLVFYFNRNTINAIPLVAGINTSYNIMVSLRCLDDISYKEQFSDFILPGTTVATIPKITNSYLMCEYIYLSTEERKIFVSGMLEYLIEEVQIDNGYGVTDKSTKAMFKVGSEKRIKTVIQNGIQTKNTEYIFQKAIDMDEDQLRSLDFSVDLLPRSDMVSMKIPDRTGVPKINLVEIPLDVRPRNINGEIIDGTFVHSKRIELEYHFGNPMETLTVTVQPDIHISTTERDDRYYFFGEKQWDNYGLYSYYDHYNIVLAKETHYSSMKIRLNDPYDDVYGFVNLLCLLIDKYTDYVSDDTHQTDRTDKWIINNLEYFVETLMFLKELFIAFRGDIVDFNNIIRLKENIFILNISYPIWEKNMLLQVINDVYTCLAIPSPSEPAIIDTYSLLISDFNINNFFMERNVFQLGIMQLLIQEITSGNILVDTVLTCIDNVYNQYNEVEINLIVAEVSVFLDIEVLTYNFETFINNFYSIYAQDNTHVEQILSMTATVLQAINTRSFLDVDIFNNYTIPNVYYKKIIYQIVPIIDSSRSAIDNYLELIPDNVVRIVSAKTNEMSNYILDTDTIDLIDCQLALIPRQQINPLLGGYLTFNTKSLFPKNYTSIGLSERPAYERFLHTPSPGINLYSWSLSPFSNQPMGAANASKIDEFNAILDVHPLIGDSYPATINTSVMSVNIVRCMSGLSGKTFWVDRGYHK